MKLSDMEDEYVVDDLDYFGFIYKIECCCIKETRPSPGCAVCHGLPRLPNYGQCQLRRQCPSILIAENMHPRLSSFAVPPGHCMSLTFAEKYHRSDFATSSVSEIDDAEISRRDWLPTTSHCGTLPCNRTTQ